MTLWPHQNAEVPMEISISLIQFVIANVLEITAYLILKFPELRLIIMLVLAPALECARCWRLLRKFHVSIFCICLLWLNGLRITGREAIPCSLFVGHITVHLTVVP
jgi:hypothetical protein